VKGVLRLWSSTPPGPRRFIRGQLRFGAFLWTGIFGATSGVMLVIAVGSAATNSWTGVLPSVAFGSLALGATAALWRHRTWLWPPLRDEDQWRGRTSKH
jgi:hypothetical protein